VTSPVPARSGGECPAPRTGWRSCSGPDVWRPPHALPGRCRITPRWAQNTRAAWTLIGAGAARRGGSSLLRARGRSARERPSRRSRAVSSSRSGPELDLHVPATRCTSRLVSVAPGTEPSSRYQCGRSPSCSTRRMTSQPPPACRSDSATSCASSARSAAGEIGQPCGQRSEARALVHPLDHVGREGVAEGVDVLVCAGWAVAEEVGQGRDRLLSDRLRRRSSESRATSRSSIRAVGRLGLEPRT
jgi:hypothetical protein